MAHSVDHLVVLVHLDVEVHSTDFDYDTSEVLAAVDPSVLPDALVVVAFVVVLDFVWVDLASVALAYEADDIVAVDHRSDSTFAVDDRAEENQFVVDRTLLDLEVLGHCLPLVVRLAFSVDFRIDSVLVWLATLRRDSGRVNLSLAVVPYINAYSFPMPVI